VQRDRQAATGRVRNWDQVRNVCAHTTARATHARAALYAAALAGALAWVHGFLERAGPVLLRGIQPRSRATALLSFAGGIVTAAGLAPLGLPHALTPIGLVILAAALLRSLRLRIAEGFANDTARLVRISRADLAQARARRPVGSSAARLQRGSSARTVRPPGRHPCPNRSRPRS